jgi:capsular polysaccharide biosynthesis protein
MKRGSLKHLAERAIHDAHSSLRKPPAMISPDEKSGGECHLLVEAGSASVMLDDECVFHVMDLPPSITRWSKACCHIFRDAHVVGDQGHVFTSNGSFVNLCPSFARLDPAKIRHPIPIMAKRLEGPVFHLTGRDHENHGHFLMQHLPRLMAASSFLEANRLTPTILTATGHEKWQGRYLGTLGDLGAKVAPCRKGTLSVPHLIYVPMLWQEGYLGPPIYYQQMQRYFRAFAGVSDAAPPSGRPVFVTRRDAPTRRLANETEILAVCRERLGEIDVVDLPKTPFLEQIRRFADAPLVIGPQGQGLTNIIFSRQSRLLILEAGTSPVTHGWVNAYRDFACMTGNSALRLFSGLPWPDDGDWLFPAEEFRRQLDRVVSLGLHEHRPARLL